MIKPISDEEFIAKYSLLNKPVEVLGKYINSKSVIRCRCKICNEEFNTTPDRLMQGQIHKKCGKKLGDIKRTSNTYEFIEKLKEVNDKIEVIGEYKNAKENIKVRCKIDGNEWETTPNKLLKGSGCKVCSGWKIYTKESFIERLKKVNPNIIVDKDTFINTTTTIKCRCKVCNHVWTTIPYNITKNNPNGCFICKNKEYHINSRKSNDDFINELNNINKNILPLEEYKTIDEKIKCKCLKCNHIWKITPNNLLHGVGCPKCRISKGERLIFNYLTNININFEEQKRFDNLRGIGGGKLSYDFYLEDLNILIEFQGLQHEKVSDYFGGNKTFLRQKEHDKRKKQFALDNNIKLLEIWYYDIDKIEEILNKELKINKIA